MAKQKYYVVWKGHKTGIFRSWAACQKQTKGFVGAQYKAFTSLKEAKDALRGTYSDYKGKNTKTAKLSDAELKRIGQPNLNSICVDAAVSGNPGKLEYRGVDTKTKKQLFKQGPFKEGTNNVGEFLAIVHALALMKKKSDNRILYSDSKTAIGWVKKKKCNTKLKPTEHNEVLFDLVDRAEQWLENNTYTTTIVKWETKAWGEIPADFGRK